VSWIAGRNFASAAGKAQSILMKHLVSRAVRQPLPKGHLVVDDVMFGKRQKITLKIQDWVAEEMAGGSRIEDAHRVWSSRSTTAASGFPLARAFHCLHTHGANTRGQGLVRSRTSALALAPAADSIHGCLSQPSTSLDSQWVAARIVGLSRVHEWQNLNVSAGHIPVGVVGEEIHICFQESSRKTNTPICGSLS
jgi:hypothetical protein